MNPEVAWIAAACSLLALILCLVNAFTCHFLRVTIDEKPEYSMGPFCPNPSANDDALGAWSAFFFAGTIAAALVGNLLAAYHLFQEASLAISRRRLWQGQSIAAALGAIATVPTFLLYQTESCTAFEHSCHWDSGSALMIATGLILVAVVLLTQCYPPDHVFRCMSLLSIEKRRPMVAATDLKVDRTMPNEDDENEEEDEGPTAILRIVGPVGHSEGIEVPMDHYHHTLAAPTRRLRRFRPWIPTPSQFAHAPLQEEEEARAVEEGRSPPEWMPAMFHSSGGEKEPPLDPIFSSADAVVASPYGRAASNPTTDDSSSSASPKDPTNSWKEPVIPNISLMDDATEVEEDDDDDEENRKPERPSVSGVSAILDDLGSLEPTVLDGEESILDNDDDDSIVHPPPPAPSKAKSYVVPSSRSSKFSPWANVIPSPSKKRPRTSRLIKGYRLLDDSDIESASYYWSPPLEILTLNLSTEQDEDLHLGDAGDTAFGTSTYSNDEPEPYLEFSDIDDDDEEEEKEEEDGDVRDHLRTIAGVRPERPVVRDTHRSRRKKRHDRSSDISMASSGSGSLNRSLFSVTIAEETAADLEEDSSSSSLDFRKPVPMKRSQSAPNLARFPSSSSSSKGRDEIYEDIHMTGIHQYHTAHIFRQKPSSSNRSEYEGSHGQRRRRKQLFDPHDRVPLLQHTNQHRKIVPSLFRAERALRAGIHDNSPDRDEDIAELLSDGDSSSVPSEPRSLRYRNARIARLKRLQQQVQHHTNYVPKVSNAAPYVSLSKIPRAATTPADSGGDPPVENHVMKPVAIVKSKVADVKMMSSQVDSVHIHISSSSSSSGLPKEEENEPNEALNTSGYASSVIDDSIGGDSYLIDLLDVQLAELNRPEGSMVGPDEASL
jgi:hypothetical protein